MLLSLPPPLIVAYSGGADSTALLLMALDAAPGRVSAVHVHHGLQAAADDFAAHAEAFCRERQVPLTVLRVNAQAAAGQSPEDAARRARYHAISEHVLKQKQASALMDSAQNAPESIANEPTVLLAQHADDQVETLLLALSRGAGVDGMAGMAARFERFGLKWARPFLMREHLMGAAQIRQFLAERGLKARQPGEAGLGQGWVEDPTNQSMDFTRNQIRALLLPQLQQVFPHYRDTIARTARNMAEASLLMTQDAMACIASVGLPPRIEALQTLSRQRQANCLRYWLKTEYLVMGSSAQMNELLDQIADCRTKAHQIRIKLASGFVRRDGAVLRFEVEA